MNRVQTCLALDTFGHRSSRAVMDRENQTKKRSPWVVITLLLAVALVATVAWSKSAKFGGDEVVVCALNLLVVCACRSAFAKKKWKKREHGLIRVRPNRR